MRDDIDNQLNGGHVAASPKLIDTRVEIEMESSAAGINDITKN
jgi:hypothetical protein